MDVDGVILQDPYLIPGSAGAVRLLREAGVPFAFMTNGGGVTEATKAKQLGKSLDDTLLNESHIILSHTPMRALADRYRGRRVLLVGGHQTVEVAESYGFDVSGGFAVTPAQIAEGTPDILPLWQPPQSSDSRRLPPVNMNADGSPPVEAVLVFFDSQEWAIELQVLTDVLLGGQPLGSGNAWRNPDTSLARAARGSRSAGKDTSLARAARGSRSVRKEPDAVLHRRGRGRSGDDVQAAEVFVSNPDLLWKAAYPAPRYGMGAYLECLRALWWRRTGQELRITEYGKPHPVQFEAARRLVEARAGRPLRRLYMVGDNPAADIRGANSAPGGLWRSILVCTGVYAGGAASNDPLDPAWRVEPDLRRAVGRLLRASDAEHLAE